MRTFFELVQAIDIFHHRASQPHPHFVRRGLTGMVFGVELPAYVIFHAVLGYLILGCGLFALLLRLPFKAVRRVSWLHPYIGLAWVFLTIYMPVTAIWCIYAHPEWDFVAFFIFSMYITIALGYISIRVWKSKTSAERLLTYDSPPAETSQIFKWLHAGFMTYSFIMLAGAGISFPFRANEDYAVGGRFGQQPL